MASKEYFLFYEIIMEFEHFSKLYILAIFLIKRKLKYLVKVNK